MAWKLDSKALEEIHFKTMELMETMMPYLKAYDEDQRSLDKELANVYHVLKELDDSMWRAYERGEVK